MAKHRMYSKRFQVGTPGTPRPLFEFDHAFPERTGEAVEAHITALGDNKHGVEIGDESVATGDGSENGKTLEKKQSITLTEVDLHEVYIDGTDEEDGVKVLWMERVTQT